MYVTLKSDADYFYKDLYFCRLLFLISSIDVVATIYLAAKMTVRMCLLFSLILM